MEQKARGPIKDQRRKKKGYGLYMKNIITRTVPIPFISVGSNIKEILQQILSTDLEGKCACEGYVKPNSVRIVNYSAGELVSNDVIFQVVIECLICNPVEGMAINVRALNITKAGIRATSTIPNSPIDVFIARDHNCKSKLFSSVKENDTFTAKIIGQRYEINDPTISVLAVIARGKRTSDKDKKHKIQIVDQ